MGLFMFLVALAGAAPETPRAVLKAVEQYYAQQKSVSADFTQSQWIAALEREKKSSGRLEIAMPGKYRWETLEPDSSLLVSDGNTLWFYTPPFTKEGRGQVIKRSADTAQSQLANALLAGRFSVLKKTLVKAGKCKDCAAGVVAIELVPEKGLSGGVKKIVLNIHRGRREISGVELRHGSGNVSKIALANIKMSGGADSSRFSFTVPDGADVTAE